jgi:hypothetical protein
VNELRAKLASGHLLSVAEMDALEEAEDDAADEAAAAADASAGYSAAADAAALRSAMQRGSSGALALWARIRAELEETADEVPKIAAQIAWRSPLSAAEIAWRSHLRSRGDRL